MKKLLGAAKLGFAARTRGRLALALAAMAGLTLLLTGALSLHWIVVAILVLLAVLLLAAILARSLTEPLEQLIQVTRRVEKGQLDVGLGVTRSDEYGEVAQAFNKMLATLRSDAQRTQQRRHELQSLVNLSGALLSSVDVRTTLESALHEAILAAHADAGAAFMTVGSGHEFQNMAVIGLPKELVDATFPIDAHTSPGYAMMQRKAITSEDIGQETRFQTLPAIVKLGVVSTLTTPMLIEGRVVGAITLDTFQKHEFSIEEINMAQVIANHTAVAMERIKLLNDLSESYDRTLSALVTALESRDRETQGHSRRVVAYTLALAEEVGAPKDLMQDLGRGAMLHDIGKIGVPDSILHKSDSLSEEDWAIVHSHPVWGKQILEGIHFLDGVAQMVLTHHERWDGLGYPQGLRGEQIPLGARIFAVVDAFDAMTSYRPYRDPRSYEKARAEIRAGRGNQFDPKVVDAFLKMNKEDWARLREQAAAGDGKLAMDMGSLKRIGSGQLQAMNVIVSAITSSLEMNEVVERAVKTIPEVTRAAAVGIYLYDAKNDRIAYVAGAHLPEELTRDGDPILESLPIKEVAQKGIAKFGEHLQTGKDKATRALHKLQPEWESTICVPLQEGSNASGVLLVFSKKPVVFSEDERILFEQVGKQLGQAIVNTRLHEKVRTQAITDALTGAYNRHYLDDFLNIEVKRCQRYQRPLALVMLDMDDFKNCNEKGGHQTGDKALKDVVQLLNIGVRSVDLVTRYGGDEFLMVLPETDRDGALEAAERMRSLIEKHRFPCGQLTASLGVAASPFKDGDAPSAQEMIGRADKALFKAKGARRNKVEMWNGEAG